MPVTVRAARDDELAEVAHICREAYDEMSSGLLPRDRNHVLDLIGDVALRVAEGTVLVAEVDGQLGGTVSYYAPGTPRNPRFEPEWTLVRILGVSLSFRRRGIARLLMDECLALARADAAPAIALQTSELTPNAVAMYERMGFTRRTEFLQYQRRYWVYALDL